MPSRFYQLHQAVQLCEQEGFTAASLPLQDLYRNASTGMDNSSEDFVAALVASSYIRSRSGQLQEENIYLKNYEVPQIRLFDILIEKFPYVTISQQMVNRHIASALQHETEACLLDIGIGLGTQVCNLLELLKDNRSLKTLHIVGIEPGKEALEVAKTRIMAMQELLPFSIRITACVGFAETMDLSTLSLGSAPLYINASLALHHIQTAAQRNNLLKTLKSFQPKGLYLIEPNVDHFNSLFTVRFKNCFRHFYHLFCTIDLLDIAQNEKNALKLFFGREIEDIIGKSEQTRFEKHEPATGWISRLQLAGWQVKSNTLAIETRPDIPVAIQHHPEGFIGFTHIDETVLALIYAN